MTLVCPSCGRENPDDARFCAGCATPLTVTPGGLREERKVVTVVFVEGDLVHAADLLREIGHVPLDAYVRLGAAERFAREGREDGAGRQLERALAFYRSVGATFYIRRGESLLAATA